VFLPALGVDISSYSGYQPNVQSDISNIFATAAYRLGHTMVTNEIPLLENNCSAIGGGSLALLDGFFNPSVIDEYGIAAFLRGLAAQTQHQRGRDHGLPDYNSVRTHYTGLAAANFSDITSDTDLQADLEAAYGSVYDIDLWVGLLSEDQLPGSSVGMTLNAILGKQFEALRDGDFYYYRNDPAISGQQRNQIKDTRLSDVIERNSDIDKLQKNVFFADDCDHDHGHGNGHGDPKKDKPKNNGNHGHGLIQNNPTSTLSVFPNPSNGKINVNLLLENPTTEVFLIVQNLNGKELYKESISVADNRVNYDLTFSQFPSGIYFVQIQSGEKVYSEKVIFK